MKKYFPSIKYLLVGLLLTFIGSNLFSQKKITGLWDCYIEYQCSGGWQNSSFSVQLSTSFGNVVSGGVMGGQIEINTFFGNESSFEIKGQDGCIRSGKLSYMEFAGREYLSGEWSSSGGANAMWGTGLCCRGRINMSREIRENKLANVKHSGKRIKTESPKKGEKKSGFDGQLRKGGKYVLKNVLFEVSSDVLLPEAKVELDKLYKVLLVESAVVIQLEGHTDIIGSEKANLQLSKRRVKATKKYLVQKGITGKRIKLKWYGGSRPLTSHGTMEERKINRRVELTVLENN